MTDTPDEALTPHALALRFDTRPMKLSGWAGAQSADQAGDEVVLSLMVGDILLGPLRREVARPDVDAYLGYAGPPSGFSAVDFGLVAFARITGLDDLAIVTSGRNVASARHAMPLVKPGDESFDPLGSRGLALKGSKLTDLWLESSRDLSLRFEGLEQAVKIVDAYQCTPGADPMLVNLAADQPVGGLLSIARVKLFNPYLPLLLVFKGDDGAIDGIDVIPFPSLVRGGMHEAERLIVGDGSDDVTGVATLSAALLRDLLARDEQRATTVARIVLDPALHTGLEPMLNDDLLSWVGDFLAIKVERSRSGARDLPAFISDKLARHAPTGEPARLVLHLPADCIPTISTLVRTVPSGFAAQTVSGSMAVREWNRHGAIWSIWQPPMGEWFAGLQGATTHLSAPQIEIRPDNHRVGDDRSYVPEWPLALAVRDMPTRVAQDSPFEVATDIAPPLLRSGALPVGTGISVVILCERSDRSITALLESLARQQDVGPIDVIVSRPTAKGDPELSATLETLFPSRHRVVAQAASMGRLDRIVALSGSIGQDQILIVDAATILPDPRTVATLLPMLDAPDVATVGCLVRVAKGKKVTLSAGYAPSAINLRAVPALSFSPIDPVAFRQPATFAVVANSAAAMVTTKAFLSGLQARGSTALRPEVDDLLLGLQAIEQGGHNLCTTLVSVYSDTAAKPTDLAISVPYRLSTAALGRIMSSTTIVQKIR